MFSRCQVHRAAVALLIFLLARSTPAAAQEVTLGGFIPYVGIGMTDEHKTLDSLDAGGIPFIADPSYSPGASLLGAGGTPYFDVAILDSGAATHFITQEAFNGFDIVGAGMRGTNFQEIGGATGLIQAEINDAGGIYAAGLGDRTAAGASLQMDAAALRGQTSVATLTAPDEWTLPSIFGLPMLTHFAVSIRNDQPQIFQYQGRTMRTPQVDFIDLGAGDQQGILRRAPLKLEPGIGFIQGPLYVYNLDFNDIIGGGGQLNVHDNPASPSVVQNQNSEGGAMFIETNLANGNASLPAVDLLLDTGADLTVISEQTADRLGFDVLTDAPDFFLEVEGSGGVSEGVPGIYLDQLDVDVLGGSFTLHNVPVAVLDVTNPNDPGNVVDGIMGMHLFNGRNIVIDANPSRGQAARRQVCTSATRSPSRTRGRPAGRAATGRLPAIGPPPGRRASCGSRGSPTRRAAPRRPSCRTTRPFSRRSCPAAAGPCSSGSKAAPR